ncbi:uncharacterized protein LOC119741723 [Patiria miniata]|uniref:PHD-type domain-containing protein n=1 Tax=Patiria miniata TaxID=46514 RepID=A0A914BCF3_PATMI|nr:uncharacterized protein LOC119741723 [Patiria miniata]
MKGKKKCEFKDSKKVYVEYDKSTGLCIYCNKDEEEGVDCGKLLTDKDRQLFVHKYCLLFASGLPQAGADTEGIEGFLVRDILKEFRRGRRLSCFYCHKKTATIGCSLSLCKRSFHFNCGVKNEALFCFFDAFLAYCRDHRPQQDVKVSESDPATVTCPICFEDVEAQVSCHTLKTPCCNNTWFHRNCVQRQALSAGYFFRCAICNNQEQFQIEMKKFGIYIPEHDASWEMDDNAFQELYWRHDKCDFDPCVCPKGRQFNKASSKWELVLCDLCGSSGCHLACGGLRSVSQDWACAMCNAMMSNATEVSCPSSASPQKSPCPGGDSPSKTGQTTRTAMKLMGKHPRTPLSSHAFRKKTASSPFSSLKLPNSPDEIANSAQDSFVGFGGNSRKNSFESSDLVGSFEHCQPSTSKQGLEDADYKRGKKRKLSYSSKENDLNYSSKSPEYLGFKKHYTWKTQSADQHASSSGLIYGPRTTLRMSMRPRKIALLQCSPVNTPINSITQTLKQSPKNAEKFRRTETISSPTAVTSYSENVSAVTEEFSSSQKVLATDKSRNVTVSHSPDQELSSCSSGAIANGTSVNKSMLRSLKDSLVASLSQAADSVGLETRNLTSFWKKSPQNATVTRPVEDEPLSCLAAKLASAVSSQKPAVPSETGNVTNQSIQQEYDKPDEKFSGNQQSTDDPDVLKPTSPTKDSCSPSLVGETSKSDTEKLSAMTQALANDHLPSCLQTYTSGHLAETDAETASPREEADYISHNGTGRADTDNNVKQAWSATNSPENTMPPPDDTSKRIAGTSDITKDACPNKVTSTVKKRKSYVYRNRYAVYGGKWRKQKKARRKQQSARLNDEANSPLLAVRTNNPRMGKEKENGTASLPSAEVEVQTPFKSPSYPQNNSISEKSPGNISGCSMTLFALFDNTECVSASPSGPENVIKPHVGAELQDDVLGPSADTTPCPSPHSLRFCETLPQQWSPCGLPPHYPSPGYHPSPDHRVSSPSGLPPDHHENSSQQSEDPVGDKTNLTRPQSTETLIKGQVKAESVDPSPKKSRHSNDIKEWKPELLPTPLLQDEKISTSQNVESMPRASTPVLLPESVKLEDDQIHSESTQESNYKTCDSQSDLQQLLKEDTPCQDVNVDCQADQPMGRKEADRSQRPKKRKDSKFTRAYPVIGTRRYATLITKTRSKRQAPGKSKRAVGLKCVQRQRRFSTGTCRPRLSQSGNKKAESQCRVRLSTGMLLRRRISSNKESVPGQKTETAGGEPAFSAITMRESSCKHLTNDCRAVDVGSSESNTVTTPSKDCEAVGNQSVIGRSKDSPRDESCSSQDSDRGDWGPEIHGARRQSTGKLLRRKYIRNRVENAQDSAPGAGGRRTERERPGSFVSDYQAQETAPRPDLILGGTTEANITQNEQISTLSGDERGGDISMEEPAIKSEISSSDTSPDSGISQGFNCSQEESPPGKPSLTPMETSESALVNLTNSDSVEKHDQPFALTQSRESSPNTPGSDTSNHMIPESKNNPTEIDASDDDDLLIESVNFEPVKNDPGPDSPIIDSSRTASPVTSVCSSSDTPKDTESHPQTVGSDCNCSTSDSSQSSGDSVQNPNPPMNWIVIPAPQMPRTPPIKPTHMEPSLTFCGRNRGSSPRLSDGSTKPMSCPGKCQSERESEILEKSHRSLRKRDSQKLCSKVRANLFKVRENRGRPLKRPRMDIPTRPVSPLVSGSDVSVTTRSKTRIYMSNSSKTTPQKEMLEVDSPKSQTSSPSGGAIRKKRLADCHSPTKSTSPGLLTSTGESPQRPWLLRSQNKKGQTVVSVESAFLLPSSASDKSCTSHPGTVTEEKPDSSRQWEDDKSGNGGDKTKVHIPNSSKVRPSRKPTEGKSPKPPTGSMPQENCYPEPGGGPHTGPDSSSSRTPKTESQRGATPRPLLLRSCSKKGVKSSAESTSPLCSPLPSSPCSSSPKQPRIYRSLPPRSTSNKQSPQKGDASSASILEKESTKSPHIKPERSSPKCVGAPSLSPIFLPNSSGGLKSSPRPTKLPRQEDLTVKKAKGRVQLFTS